jgi:chromate transporter
MKKSWNLYWKLFTSTLLLSAFTVGGGYVIVPLMKKRFVDKLNWIEEAEMLNLVAIAQSSPGAIAINASILIGYRMAGTLGTVVTVFGAVIPPLITITIISYFYNAFRSSEIIGVFLRGMQAGVTAVIADVVIDMCVVIINKKQILSILMMITAFIAAFIFEVNAVLIILICAAIGLVTVLIREKLGKGRN